MSNARQSHEIWTSWHRRTRVRQNFDMHLFCRTIFCCIYAVWLSWVSHTTDVRQSRDCQAKHMLSWIQENIFRVKTSLAKGFPQSPAHRSPAYFCLFSPWQTSFYDIINANTDWMRVNVEHRATYYRWQTCVARATRDGFRSVARIFPDCTTK